MAWFNNMPGMGRAQPPPYDPYNDPMGMGGGPQAQGGPGAGFPAGQGGPVRADDINNLIQAMGASVINTNVQLGNLMQGLQQNLGGLAVVGPPVKTTGIAL